jgi:hypothetical protein
MRDQAKSASRRDSEEGKVNLATSPAYANPSRRAIAAASLRLRLRASSLARL